jgi:hypothetical protein
MGAPLPGEPKSPIEGLNEFHGKRPDVRRTNGTPERSAFFLYAKGLQLDFLRLGFEKLAEDLDKAIDFAANTWAGHQGWDTERAIQMVEAGTSLRINPLASSEESTP